ncbi:MAG: protease Do [Blastocatellia bacterium]|nr:MAG: protease Do [Blastocatellia bacterium]
MSNLRSPFGRQWTRVSLALVAAAALLGGATWRGAVAANTQSTAERAASAPASANTRPLAGARDSYADIVKIVSPAVVTVTSNGTSRISQTDFQVPDEDFFRRFFGDQFDRGQRRPRTFRQTAVGSGVIVSTDGYILTNNHVIENGEDIKVKLTDDRVLPAKLVGADKASDLAVLKVNSSDLHPLTLGNSDDVQVGDVVLAVGNPLNLGQTVTMGIISAKGRSTGVGDGSYEDFLQTDAPINHGNSGGALVNTKGQLVGINSQILSPSDGNIGIGFAIPANMARHVMDELRTTGKVTRGRLGVIVQPVTSDIAASLGLKQAGGAIVAQVEPGSAAERAGVKQGDVIMSFNGQPVHDTNTLRNRIADTKPGSSADVVIQRDGSEKTLSVKLDEASPEKSARHAEEPASDDKAALGISVAPVTPELAARRGLPRDTHGLIVEDVNPDGRAADAGLRTGDIIEQVNRQPVDSVDALRTAVRRSADKPLLLLVNREGRNAFVTVRPAV